MKRELLNSIITLEEASHDYSSLIHDIPVLNTVAECSLNYHLYGQAIEKSRNNVLLFTVYQGRVLEKLRDDLLKDDKEKYRRILKEYNISTQKVNFRIRLFKGVSSY